MIGWIVLGVGLAAFLLIVLCRVGVEATFGEQTTVTAHIGLLRLQIVPRPENKDRKPKKKQKPKEEKTPKPKMEASVVMGHIPQIWDILKKGLHMTRRRLQICPMELSVIIGGADPADAAILYGKAQAAMWTLMPQLERLVRMPQPHIHLEPELQGGKTKCFGQIGISILIWDLLVVGFACGVPMVKLLLEIRKQSTDTNNRSGKDE